MKPDPKIGEPAVTGRTGTRPRPPVRKASSLVFFFIRATLRPALFLLYRFSFDMKSSKAVSRPCLILCNHQTGFDQFAVSVGFRFGINFVATDTIFRHGILSKLMVLLTRPIPFSKGNSDLVALRNMMGVIKSGGCVGMFPSGNRCLYGDECRIVPGIGKLAKKFAVPLVLMRIEGGFNTLARWRVKRNVGKVTAAVTKVLQPDELAVMSPAEVDSVIQSELGFDEFAWNKTAGVVFRGRRRAEYLESVLFFCPQCNRMPPPRGGASFRRQRVFLP